MIEVSLFGNKVGVLEQRKEGIFFDFYDSFRAKALPISPYKLDPEVKMKYNYFDSMFADGMPGIFNDSMPDGYGAILMLKYFKQKKHTGIITPLQKLAFIGTDGIGALEYTPSENYHELFDIDIATLPKTLKSNYEGSVSDVLSNLIKLPSPGGARPKTSVLYSPKANIMKGGHTCNATSDLEPWIIKFDEENSQTTILEKLYQDIAYKSGILTPVTQLLHVRNEVHFAIKRFDRIGKDKLHQATVSGLQHLSHMEINNFSYENLLVMTQQLTKDMAQVQDMYKRMVLNVVGANCDDHLKNTSFTMNILGEWNLSPIYDVVYNTGPATFGEHFLSVNQKNKNITKKDLIIAGQVVNLSKSEMNEYISDVVDNFNDSIKNIHEYNLNIDLVLELKNNVRLLL
ncbi:type II toxin-antitoxin system HipA family toxin [Sulfurimonas sp. SAG-AH-194-I05]|nr:type II toxin-antitoxin system HipA family toxin [Sulfurimonas sp. SAG-AH-194-I05]MDF1875661.1 type II toxin-antitoxin system HipA family toxin [Sulfurimonas sp. SAG-AH-194-I05]